MGFEISRKNHERITEGAILIWLGRVIGKMQAPNDKNAYKNILRGIKISEELTHRPDLALGYFFLGEFYADRNMRKEAVEYLKKALGLFDEMEMQHWTTEANKVLSKLQNTNKIFRQ